MTSIDTFERAAQAEMHHNASLDGFRGALAMWVFAFHAAANSGFFTEFLPPGAIAVDLFMVVSGLLMTQNFIFREPTEGLGTKKSIFRFFIRRFFRIAPLYYLLLMFALLTESLYIRMENDIRSAIPFPWADLTLNDPSVRLGLSAVNVLSHLSFLYGFFPSLASNNSLPDWSLSLEMQFYAAIPFILLAGRKFGFFRLLLTIFVIQYVSASLIGLYLSPKNGILWPQPSLLNLKINLFAVGIFLALYLHRRGVGELILLLLALAYQWLFFDEHFSFVVGVLGCLLLLVGDIGVAPLQILTLPVKNLLSSDIARFLGRISFSVYLLHSVVLIPILWLLVKFGGHLNVPPSTRFIIVFFVTSIFVIPLSTILHSRVELPLIEHGRRLARKVS